MTLNYSRLPRYFIVFMLPIAVAVVSMGASYLVLRGFGETVSPVEAARLQEIRDVRYSSSIAYRPRPYKIERAVLRQRETLIVGSSRVMQFVAAPWQDNATNAGGAVRDIESAEIFFDEVLKVYRPARVIIGVDWWWFAENRAPDSPGDLLAELDLSLANYLLPLEWVAKGDIGMGSIWRGAVVPDALPAGIGYAAKFGYSGWDAFGHYDYGKALMRSSKFSDVEFQETLEEVQSKSATNYRSPSARFSPQSWQRFERLLDRLVTSGIEVMIFIPPVAEPLYRWIEAQPEPNLINEVRRHLASGRVASFDYHDPAVLGIPSCEFLDGQHAGEVAFLRILQAMALDARSKLRDIVDVDMIAADIAANAGRASIRRPGQDRPPEIDFLGLGCKK